MYLFHQSTITVFTSSFWSPSVFSLRGVLAWPPGQSYFSGRFQRGRSPCDFWPPDWWPWFAPSPCLHCLHPQMEWPRSQVSTDERTRWRAWAPCRGDQQPSPGTAPASRTRAAGTACPGMEAMASETWWLPNPPVPLWRLAWITLRGRMQSESFHWAPPPRPNTLSLQAICFGKRIFRGIMLMLPFWLIICQPSW